MGGQGCVQLWNAEDGWPALLCCCFALSQTGEPESRGGISYSAGPSPSKDPHWHELSCQKEAPKGLRLHRTHPHHVTAQSGSTGESIQEAQSVLMKMLPLISLKWILALKILMFSSPLGHDGSNMADCHDLFRDPVSLRLQSYTPLPGSKPH